jgi:hypothetical protein
MIVGAYQRDPGNGPTTCSCRFAQQRSLLSVSFFSCDVRARWSGW